MRRMVTWMAMAAMALAACGGGEAADGTDATTPSTDATTTTQATTTTTDATTTTTEATTTTTGASGPQVTVADSSLGTILVDGDGNTLYLFLPDNEGDSVCYDQCAQAWPPLTGTVTAGEGVDASLLGTAPRTDGPDQVTYNGWPLYYFANDGAPGDTNGQGINEVWYVLGPDGFAIGVRE